MMTNQQVHDSATSNVLAWSSQAAHMQHESEDEVAAEVDEPPDNMVSQFKKRTTVRRPADNSSLLSKALHQSDEEDLISLSHPISPPRRRSLNSLASTVDLTSDTGLTSPARTNTPSPPPPVFHLGRLDTIVSDAKLALSSAFGAGDTDTTPTKKAADKPVISTVPKDTTVETLVKKRCISFACGGKPQTKKAISPPKPSPVQTNLPQTQEQPTQRKTCIKFACGAKPVTRETAPTAERPTVKVPEVIEPIKRKDSSPATVRKYRSPSATRSRRSLTPRRRQSNSPVALRSKKYLTVNPAELNREGSRFHEFASDEPQEDDWIRQNVSPSGRRLTITDTLRKENEIRRLGKEAEEEAEQEEEENDLDNEDGEEDDPDNLDDEDNEFDDEDNEEDEFNVDDEHSGYGSDDDYSDGYKTDTEVGFAESDDEDDAGDLADLWTHGQLEIQQLPGATAMSRLPSAAAAAARGIRSESSTSDEMGSSRPRERSRRIKIRPGTPELPDSTDFVCGTLDEDRPLEDAYISCLAQKKREKMHIIPQDIDPSFPTSEPEDEDEEPASRAQDSDDNLWIHGELEDLHHEQERNDRRKRKGDHASPKRYHSPAPKRHHSPAPKTRGRSPRRLFDRHSPRRLMSPPPLGKVVPSPPASLLSAHNGPQDFKTLAFRPGLTQTKSLPRAPAMFPNHLKGQRRRQAARTGATGHVRGAIDIVKGLEQKRQRRREKYVQKYCNRARKGQVHEKRPQPGQGAERMRDIGLHIAGKTGHGGYVISC